MTSGPPSATVATALSSELKNIERLFHLLLLLLFSVSLLSVCVYAQTAKQKILSTVDTVRKEMLIFIQ